MVESIHEVLVGDCKASPKENCVTMQTKGNNAKRRFSDPVAQSSLCRGNKKVRRCNSWELRPSKVRWKLTVHREDGIASASIHDESTGTTNQSSEPLNHVHDTWYSKEEYKKIMLDQYLTVQIMRSLRILVKKEGNAVDDWDESGDNENGKSRCEELIKKLSIDPKEYCERGLESYRTDEGRKKINLGRKRHKLSVINEYKRQGMTGMIDPELLRSVSIAESTRSYVKAQWLASIDQQEAQASNCATKGDQDEEQKQQKKHIPLNSLGSQRVSSCTNQPNGTLLPSTQTNDLITQPFHNAHFVQKAISDKFFRQHQLQQQHHESFLKQHSCTLLRSQQLQPHHAQSQIRYQHLQPQRNELMDILQSPPCASPETSMMLAAVKEQQLFRRDHLQHNYQVCHQENLQRLVYHQRQEQLRILGLASAALVVHSPR